MRTETERGEETGGGSEEMRWEAKGRARKCLQGSGCVCETGRRKVHDEFVCVRVHARVRAFVCK